jgi:hypothetical protein
VLATSKHKNPTRYGDHCLAQSFKTQMEIFFNKIPSRGHLAKPSFNEETNPKQVLLLTISIRK